MCWLNWRFVCHLCEQRRLCRVCTFAHACLSLRHSTKLTCAGSNGDVCTFNASSEGSGESANACLGLRHSTAPKSHMLAKMAICVPFMRAVKAQTSLHIAQACLSLRHTVLAQIAIFVPFMQAAKTLVSLHDCADSHEPFSH